MTYLKLGQRLTSETVHVVVVRVTNVTNVHVVVNAEVVVNVAIVVKN